MRMSFKAIVTGACFCLLAPAVHADEQSVALSDLPQKVAASVKARFPRAKLLKASKEKEDGELHYEVAINLKEQAIDVTLKEDGTIVEIEKTIDAQDLPAAVSDALKTKYPKSTFKKAEEIIKKEKLESYEVLLVTADKKKVEVSVSPDGKIVNEEKKGEEKDK